MKKKNILMHRMSLFVRNAFMNTGPQKKNFLKKKFGARGYREHAWLAIRILRQLRKQLAKSVKEATGELKPKKIIKA